MKILTVIGARPQFIKTAVLSKILRKFHKEVIVHTGQHYDKNMSDIFFKELSIPKPDYNLNVGSASHAMQTAKIMEKLEIILIKEKPDYILVYGDTNSTLAAALTGSKMNIKIIHVESGLRSFNMKMPEEINRILTDHISSLLFVPTKNAKENLKKEGIVKNVYVIGDVMCDAVKQNINIAEKKSTVLKKFSLKKRKFIFLTIHRQELIPQNKKEINNFLIEMFHILGEKNEKVIFPIHPRTKDFLKKNNYINKINKYKNIIITEPKSYLDCLWFIKNARIVITDSGGIQKETYILGTPCITVRSETEWLETVSAGWNCVTGFNKDKFYDAIHNFHPTRKRPLFYGNGSAGEKIAKIINGDKGTRDR